MPSTDIVRIFCENLRRLRKETGLTQEQVAERAAIGYRHYQDIEAGRRPGLQLATVGRLAAGLGVEFGQLFVAIDHAASVRKPKRAAKR